MQIYVVFHGPILANFFFLKNIYIRDIKSNEKPLRTILLNLDGFSTFNDWSISGCSKIGPQRVRCVWASLRTVHVAIPVRDSDDKNSSSVKQYRRQPLHGDFSNWDVWTEYLQYVNSFYGYCVHCMPSITEK